MTVFSTITIIQVKALGVVNFFIIIRLQMVNFYVITTKRANLVILSALPNGSFNSS